MFRMHEIIDLPYVFELQVTNILREVNANVFKFNREKKRFERAKVNSRCFHWFPAAIFESLRGAPTWRPLGSRVSILNSLIFSDAPCRIIRVRSIIHPCNFGTLFNYYSSTIFQFSDSVY